MPETHKDLKWVAAVCGGMGHALLTGVIKSLPMTMCYAELGQGCYANGDGYDIVVRMLEEKRLSLNLNSVVDEVDDSAVDKLIELVGLMFTIEWDGNAKHWVCAGE